MRTGASSCARGCTFSLTAKVEQSSVLNISIISETDSFLFSAGDTDDFILLTISGDRFSGWDSLEEDEFVKLTIAEDPITGAGTLRSRLLTSSDTSSSPSAGDADKFILLPISGNRFSGWGSLVGEDEFLMLTIAGDRISFGGSLRSRLLPSSDTSSSPLFLFPLFSGTLESCPKYETRGAVPSLLLVL